MSVITEASLRALLKNNKEQEVVISKNDIVTPSAKAFINERKLTIAYKEDKDKSKAEKCDEAEVKRFMPKYEFIGGGFFEEKPEFMTHIYGNKLVFKNHSIIVFRGKVDNMQSKILEAQVIAVKAKKESLAIALEEILGIMRAIMRAEVLNEELTVNSVLGFSDEDLRNISHNPNKYFNRDHIIAEYKMGELVICINSLRSYVREVEIAALDAFKEGNGEVKRQDILKCLNRLSSVFYIIMHRLLSNEYK